jgi:hypothetical protein
MNVKHLYNVLFSLAIAGLKVTWIDAVVSTRLATTSSICKSAHLGTLKQFGAKYTNLS